VCGAVSFNEPLDRFALNRKVKLPTWHEYSTRGSRDTSYLAGPRSDNTPLESCSNGNASALGAGSDAGHAGGAARRASPR
jgi:hypothetical protein